MLKEMRAMIDQTGFIISLIKNTRGVGRVLYRVIINSIRPTIAKGHICSNIL